MSNPLRAALLKLARAVHGIPEEVTDPPPPEKTAAEIRREEDTELWNAWKSNPSKQTVAPLLKKFEPDLNYAFTRYRSPNTPDAYLKMRLLQHQQKALESWDPNHPKQTALRTHVVNSYRKGWRDNNQFANAARIPDDVSARIGDVQAIQDAFQEEMGRPPTPAEVAARFNTPDRHARQRLTPAKVKRIQQYQMGDVAASSFESDPTERAASMDRQVMSQLRPTLSPEAQKVYDILYADGKARTMSNKALAKKLGISESQSSRLKTEIVQKHRKYST